MAFSPERLHGVLQKIRDGISLRDGALKALGARIAATDAVDDAIDWVETGFPEHVAAAAESAAAVAATVQVAGRGAEASYRRVKQLDERLIRVRAALDVVRAVASQRRCLEMLPAVMNSSQWDKATELVEEYDRMAKVLGGFFPVSLLLAPSRETSTSAPSDDRTAADSDSAETLDPDVGTPHDKQQSHSTPDTTIAATRAQLRTSLLSEIAACRDASGSDSDIARPCSLLGRLGYVDEARDAFTLHVVDAVRKELRVFVSEALSNIAVNKTTHLMACVAVLDRIAAAMERHKKFVETEFKGPASSLILALHAEATHHCVDVLRDFLQSRRGVVNRGSTTTTTTARPPPSQSLRTAPPVDPRSLDQTLEDIAHLLACCQQYVSFVMACVLKDEEEGPKDAKQQQMLIAKVRDSPLFEQLGSLIGVYVPVQNEYLDGAFNVITRQCDEAIAATLAPIRGALGTLNSAASTSSTSAAILSTLWGTSPSPAVQSTLPPDYYPNSPKLDSLLRDMTITLVDDAFHMLLVALRRAMSTRDVSIASSTLVSVNNALTDFLIPELRRRLDTDSVPQTSAASAGSVEAAVASAVASRLRSRWLHAASSAIEYIAHLSRDVEQAAAANFSGADVFRLSEQRHDLTVTMSLFKDFLNSRLASEGQRLGSAFLDVAGPALDTASYIIRTEAAYINAGIADNWATLGIAALREHLPDYAAPFPEDARDSIVMEALRSVVARVAQTIPRKLFDAFGALQIDREVRVVRVFFSDLVEGHPVRETFARVQSMLAVLLAESVAEAEAEGLAAGLDRPTLANLISHRFDHQHTTR